MKDATAWRLDGDLPSTAAEIVVSDSKPSATSPRLMFSAMDASVATEINAISHKPVTSSFLIRAIIAWMPTCRSSFLR